MSKITGITLAIFIVTVVLGGIWQTRHPSPLSRNLDPPPGPYTWSRINPESNLTCLIVETSYNSHSIGLWCERMENTK